MCGQGRWISRLLMTSGLCAHLPCSGSNEGDTEVIQMILKEALNDYLASESLAATKEG